MRTSITLLASFLLFSVGCALPYDDELDEAEAIADAAAPIMGGTIAYRLGLVRIEPAAGGHCSGVLLGPNLIATAAHCVAHGGAGAVAWDLDARITYKPDASTTMCLEDNCQDTYQKGSQPRFGKFKVTWPLAYNQNPMAMLDIYHDVALIWADGKRSLSTHPVDANHQQVRSLNIDDYLAIAKNVPGARAVARGYGFNTDTNYDRRPREIAAQVLVAGTKALGGTVGPGVNHLCLGDSGGPLIGESRSHKDAVAGLASWVDVKGDPLDPDAPKDPNDLPNACPDTGDGVYWHRLWSSIGFINQHQYNVGGLPCHCPSDYCGCWL